MAEKGLEIDQDTFCCSICLDLLKDPVTIPCGHSYCMSCVKIHWDGEVGKQSFSCPQCRQSFTQRPVLVKNTMLAILMEGLKKTAPPPAPAHPCYAEPNDVVCDMCSGRKKKAMKSCLQCLVSYCKEHLQPHYDVAALRKHKLVDPTENLQENICSRHDEVMKMFCRTDQQCICYLCSVDEHKDHDIVSAAAARNERQGELDTCQQKILHRIKDKEKDVEVLQLELKNISRSADRATEHSDKSFKELIRLIEKRMTEVKRQIKSQQETEERRVKDVQEKLQQEITELKTKYAELEKLSHTDDHYQFLHNFPSLSKVTETSDSPNISKTPLSFLEVVTAAVSEVRGKLQEPLDPPAEVQAPQQTISEERPASSHMPSQEKSTSEEWPALTRANLKLKPPVTMPPPRVIEVQRQGIEDVRAYTLYLSLDFKSTNNQMKLSNNNRTVELTPFSHPYRPHPARFTDFYQVVSKESLTGRCYWEVLGACRDVFTVAVAYKDIQRDGRSSVCCFGKNKKSWALECGPTKYVFWHNGCSTVINGLFSREIGVFLDHSAGTLAFYALGTVDTLIHRIQTSFTRPLVAGFQLHEFYSTAEFCQPDF